MKEKSQKLSTTTAASQELPANLVTRLVEKVEKVAEEVKDFLMYDKCEGCSAHMVHSSSRMSYN